MSVERKQGIIRSWNENRGYGIIRVGPQASLERYFLHVSHIRSGTASPKPGFEVFFTASDAPLKRQSDLPQALAADVIVPDEPVADGGTR
jgi:cold shock CspA family protein